MSKWGFQGILDTEGRIIEGFGNTGSRAREVKHSRKNECHVAIIIGRNVYSLEENLVSCFDNTWDWEELENWKFN
jgi:hypothetical protein